MNCIIDKNHPTKTSSLEQPVKFSSRDLFKIRKNVRILGTTKLADIDVSMKK